MTRWNKTYNYNIDCGCGNSCGEPCGCKTTLSALCVKWNNNDLECTGVKKGDNLEEILKSLDEQICQIIEKLENPIVIASVGTGEDVYAGEDEDGVNLIKTITHGDGVTVSSTDELITVSIDEEYVDSTLKPIIDTNTKQTNDIAALKSAVSQNTSNIASNTQKGADNSHEIDQLEERMDDVEECCSTNTADIGNLEKSINNKIDSEINALKDDIALLDEKTESLDDSINGNKTSISSLSTKIDQINETASSLGIVHTYETTGQTISQLPEKATEILRVSYCGATLPKAGWVFQNGNQIALQIRQYGLTLDSGDVIQIEYRAEI